MLSKEDEANLVVYQAIDKVVGTLIKTAKTKENTPVYRELIETANAVMNRPVSDASLRAVRERNKVKLSTFEPEAE